MINYFKLLILVFFSLALLQGLNAQDKQEYNITIRVEDKPLIDVIEQLEANYSLHFRFKHEWIEGKRTTVSISNSSLESTLQTIFAPIGINFLVRDKNLIVLLKDGNKTFTVDTDQKDSPDNIIAIGTVKLGLKNALLTGKIIDGETSESIPGVVVYTNTNSTVTDLNGNYSIDLPVGINTINYQHKGFTNMTFVVLLNSNGNFNLSMYENIHQLDEIVISSKEKDANVTEVITGTETMSLHQIKKMPAMLGEVDLE